MSKKKQENSGGVTFSCRADSAAAVYLVGTFNDWDPLATPLVEAEPGEWSVTLDLAPETYEYKFVVDGVWCCEPGNDDLIFDSEDSVPNAFGTRNRTIEVS